MKEARAHSSAVQQGGLAACAHEKQPQLQDEQLGGSSAEDAARADKRQGAPSSAARAPRSLPDSTPLASAKRQVGRPPQQGCDSSEEWKTSFADGGENANRHFEFKTRGPAESGRKSGGWKPL